MDELHQAVTQCVEKAAQADEDPALTFLRVRALAQAARDGREPAAVACQVAPGRSRPPRLSEPWFC
jgi:hypothetical protein